MGKVSKVEGRKNRYYKSCMCGDMQEGVMKLMSPYMYKYKLSLICCHWHCCTLATMPDDNKVTISCIPLYCGDTCMNFGKQWEAFVHTVSTLIPYLEYTIMTVE